MKTLDELMLLADAYADYVSNKSTVGRSLQRAALATALAEALNTTPTMQTGTYDQAAWTASRSVPLPTTPAVPDGVPGGAHTVGEVMELAREYAASWELGGCMKADQALLAAVTKLVSDRDVLLVEMHKLACLGMGEVYGNSNGNMIARAAIQKVTK